MTISLKTRLKVLSVSSIQSPDGKTNVSITFVQEQSRPPSVGMTPQSTPKPISNVVFQVQKGIQKVLPRRTARSQKIVLIFTTEELEAFNMKPYPNQTYEITISDGKLQFKEI
jgi:hypothetical protein